MSKTTSECYNIYSSITMYLELEQLIHYISYYKDFDDFILHF